MQTNIFQEMANKWPSAWVARQEVSRFTGGCLIIRGRNGRKSMKTDGLCRNSR